FFHGLEEVSMDMLQQDNEDTKKNTLTFQAEMLGDESGQHGETEIKNSVGVIYPEMSTVAAAHSIADGSLGNIKADTEPSQGDHVGVTDDSDSSSFTVVLFGNVSAVHLGEENILLGAEHVPPDQAHHPRKIKVSGRGLSVVNILDLHEDDLYLDHVNRITPQLVTENNIHAFIFVLKLGQFTDDDKLGLEWLEKKFGENILSFVIILFTYETEEECDTIIDDLKNNTVLEQLTKKCQGRYCTCSMSMNKHSEISTVLNKIDQLICENNQCSYTAETYNTGLKFRDDVQGRMRQKDIRQEDPLFQDASKHNSEIKIEITDDYSKTTRDAFEQSKADEHDGITQELISIQKDGE
ncbi:interferon-induced very large GTPase 1-like protein, partial [Clarias magur]